MFHYHHPIIDDIIINFLSTTIDLQGARIQKELHLAGCCSPRECAMEIQN